jgi:hypothetical protein
VVSVKLVEIVRLRQRALLFKLFELHHLDRLYYSSMAVQCVQKKGTAYSQALTGHAQNQKRIPRCDGQHRRRATIHTRRHDMPAVAFLRESSVSEDESCTQTVHTNSYRRTEYSFHTARYLVLCPKRNVHLNLIKDI